MFMYQRQIKMLYGPDIHYRRSIRLTEYDYSREGLYFVTVCCQDMKCRFGKIKNGEMVLNAFEKIAHDEWCKLPDRGISIAGHKELFGNL